MTQPAPQTRSTLEASLHDLNAQLSVGDALNPTEEIPLRRSRAHVLTDLGRPFDARADYLRILALDPAHRETLFDLGRLLIATGYRQAARVVYEKAIEHYPDDIACRVNLGSALLQYGDPAAARPHYEAALRLDPDFPQAHGGLFYVLSQLGEYTAAALHQQKAFGGNNIFACPYRGSGEPIPVLLLVASTGGNTPIEKLLDEEIFQTYAIVVDFFDANAQLPEHRLIVNGIGDPDVSSHALEAAERLASQSSVPILNAPNAILATGRCANAERFANLPGLVAPRTASLPWATLAGPSGPQALRDAGFNFPLLLRTPGYHMGQHFTRVESPETLAAEVAQLPGADRSDAELLAIEYLDARGSDGAFRKYRVMFVGGRIFPLHLAIAPNWKIHYFNADMKDRPDHRAEELLFLTDMPRALGPKAIATLLALQSLLRLDYGGIDFGLDTQGNVLLFEANATMVVEQPSDDPRWDYRRTAVSRIQEAVREMLLRSAGATRTELTDLLSQTLEAAGRNLFKGGV
jgi:tetratricopeptide (TPR) repeat protein